MLALNIRIRRTARGYWVSGVARISRKYHRSFGQQFDVDIEMSTDASVKVCMSPGGVADTWCNNFNSPVTVAFVLNSDSASARMLTLGQMEAD